METHISPLFLDRQRAEQLIAGFEAIEYKHLHALKAGFAQNPRYNLDFAQQKLDEATRHYWASKEAGKPVTDDPAIMTDLEYLHRFAKWANIHHNWPGVLFKAHELDAWKRYILAQIAVCNQAGFYFHEVMKGSNYTEGIPKWLTDRVNHFNVYCEVEVAMLIKRRWYRFTMSRFHKQGRLDQYEDEFKAATIHEASS